MGEDGRERGWRVKMKVARWRLEMEGSSVEVGDGW